MRLFVYNPDSDLALAAGGHGYTPPASISRLRREADLTQLPLCREGDAILRLDRREVARVRNGMAVSVGDASTVIPALDIESVYPWGWNEAIRVSLLRLGVEEKMMPSFEKIETYRRLSHRRLTIAMTRILEDELKWDLSCPVEATNLEAALTAIDAFGHAFFKAPWSSSGRGVWDNRPLTEGRIRELLTGCIKRQGSVMVERAWEVSTNCATEWMAQGGELRFLGYSVFATEGSGNYRWNLDSREWMSSLEDCVRRRLEKASEAQQKALARLVAPHYEGPLGVDMIITPEGMVNPCVEVNLRTTMGHVQLAREGVEIFGQGPDL